MTGGRKMDCAFTGLTEEQKQIKALTRDFCKREVDAKRIKAIEEKVFLAKTWEEVMAVYPRDLLRKMHELGLRQLGIPEKYGGTEPESGGNVTRALAAEEMGYFSGPVAIMLTSGYIGCSLAFASHYITEKQREEFASHFVGNPELVLAGTVSEPESGTDPHLPYDEPGVALKVTGRKVGNEWILN